MRGKERKKRERERKSQTTGRERERTSDKRETGRDKIEIEIRQELSEIEENVDTFKKIHRYMRERENMSENSPVTELSVNKSHPNTAYLIC